MGLNSSFVEMLLGKRFCSKERQKDCSPDQLDPRGLTNPTHYMGSRFQIQGKSLQIVAKHTNLEKRHCSKLKVFTAGAMPRERRGLHSSSRHSLCAVVTPPYSPLAWFPHVMASVGASLKNAGAESEMLPWMPSAWAHFTICNPTPSQGSR